MTPASTPPAPMPSSFRFITLAWLATAIVFAIMLPAPDAPTPVRLALTVLPLLFFTVSLWLSPGVFAAVSSFDARWLMSAHGIRLPVGFAFLVLGKQGLLPMDFAEAAGIGDMLAGAGGLALALVWPRISNSRSANTILLLWNVFGLVDFLNVQRLVYVVAVAQDRGAEFIAMRHLPLALVPYIGVPALFAIHLFFIMKLLRHRAN